MWLLVIISLATGTVVETKQIMGEGFEGQHACMKMRPFEQNIYSEAHPDTLVGAECRYAGSIPAPAEVFSFQEPPPPMAPPTLPPGPQ